MFARLVPHSLNKKRKGKQWNLTYVFRPVVLCEAIQNLLCIRQTYNRAEIFIEASGHLPPASTTLASIIDPDARGGSCSFEGSTRKILAIQLRPIQAPGRIL